VEVPKLLNRSVPLRVALAVVILLPIVGYFIGQIGGNGGSSTAEIQATVSSRSLTTDTFAESKTVTVVISNPNDYGVRVASISESRSEATGSGCPEGFLTTEAVADPSGYIKPGGVYGYQVPVKVSGEQDGRCQGQLFTLPLTVEFVSSGE
jgi:hypothetical protein